MLVLELPEEDLVKQNLKITAGVYISWGMCCNFKVQ